MLHIQSNYPLKNYNTFGISAKASFFAELNAINDIEELISSDIFRNEPHIILGGGSNMLFTRDYQGFIMHSTLAGIACIKENSEESEIRVGSGVEWDKLVIYAVENELGGIENLSGIPGNVGASPVQNIGAYGVEVRDTIINVEGFDFRQKKIQSYNNKECRFGYRTSIFKEQFKNEFLITHVTFRLKKPPHKLVTEYGAIKTELEKYGEKSISTLRRSVIAIRNSKLPDPLKTGNAGSFFKNPVVTKELADKVKTGFPEVPTYAAAEGFVKLSAAWLIEQSGCKGIQKGQAASHKIQPLVLINLGGATGNEILELAQIIEHRVYEKFGITLVKEVNIV
jgi:UDP-N-acetylmuramate dehydrogenase